jgi:hypothetical protein
MTQSANYSNAGDVSAGHFLVPPLLLTSRSGFEREGRGFSEGAL